MFDIGNTYYKSTPTACAAPSGFLRSTGTCCRWSWLSARMLWEIRSILRRSSGSRRDHTTPGSRLIFHNAIILNEQQQLPVYLGKPDGVAHVAGVVRVLGVEHEHGTRLVHCPALHHVLRSSISGAASSKRKR